MLPGRGSALLYAHSAFAGHDTTPHPENPLRAIAIDRELRRRGLCDGRSTRVWDMATDDQILRVHGAGLLSSLKGLVASGGGEVDPDTIAFPDSLDAARFAAGAGIDAVEALCTQQATTAFVLGRPPGHHATRHRAMGFCLLNTVAITAAHARARGFDRVAIVDWDVHHGNGTEAIFYDRADILFCSTHQYGRGFFPGTGSDRDCGAGPGHGFTLNVPLSAGDGDAAVIGALQHSILPAVHSFQPDIILVSAGFDAHVDDPLGGLRVTDEGFRALASLTWDVAREVCGGRLIAVLEGGYHPVATARCVADMVVILDGSSI